VVAEENMMVPAQIELPNAWVGAEELPVHFANAFGAVVGPHTIFLNIGSVVPPSIAGATDDERRAEVQALSYIPVKPIARIALAPEGLDELITMLQETRKNHQKLLGAMGKQSGEGS
jgi:hypothetical protein